MEKVVEEEEDKEKKIRKGRGRRAQSERKEEEEAKEKKSRRLRGRRVDEKVNPVAELARARTAGSPATDNYS